MKTDSADSDDLSHVPPPAEVHSHAAVAAPAVVEAPPAAAVVAAPAEVADELPEAVPHFAAPEWDMGQYPYDIKIDPDEEAKAFEDFLANDLDFSKFQVQPSDSVRHVVDTTVAPMPLRKSDCAVMRCALSL